MSSHTIKKERAERIRTVREAGGQAYLDGRHINTVREFAEIDRRHWLDSYLGERNRKHLGVKENTA